MKRTVKALQDLYVKLGGQLTDTYAGIADGIKVGLYKRIPDIIEAVKEKASDGGGAGLPEVTAADNGDVLTVVEGAWAKAAPSGDDVFDIKFTATYDETTGRTTASCNKSTAEILAEYQANGYDNMRTTLVGSDGNAFAVHLYVDDYPTDPSITARFLDAPTGDNYLYLVETFLWIDESTQEDAVSYEKKTYSLTPSE